MRMKALAGGAFFLNTFLFATYYAVAKEALGRIDPIVFSFFEMLTLAPAGICILLLTRRHVTRALLKRGVLLGSSLCLALFTISIALKYTTATGTAFFPALNGFLAALIAWVVFRQPLRKATWLAGILSAVGTLLLILNSEMGGARGSLIAFLGGLFFTCYVFLSEKAQEEEMAHWPLFGVELVTMAAWACLVALLFGNWQTLHPQLPKDALVILYVASACTFLPTLLAVLMQKHISAITVSFIYILEPVLAAGIANVYLQETLSLNGYLGGGLVVVGAVVHTLGSIEKPKQFVRQPVPQPSGYRLSNALMNSWFYPALCCCIGIAILYGLGGFPPRAWLECSAFAPTLLHALMQGQGVTALTLFTTTLSSDSSQAETLLLVLIQALCWLVAWSVLLVMITITISRGISQLTQKRRRRREIESIDTMVIQSLARTEDLQPWDTRTLRQMGVSHASVTRHSRTTDKLSQVPRRERQQHLARVELVEYLE